jgi:hypothetical protein
MKNKFFQTCMSIGAGLLLTAAFVPSAMAATTAAGKPTTPYVSAQAEETIADNFPAAHNLYWENEVADVHTAFFTQRDTKTVANVDDNGELSSVLMYFNQARIPGRVRDMLSDKFPDRQIKGLSSYELENGGFPSVSYQATMEDAAHWYIVTIDGKDVQTTQVLDKA